jgi:two-component system cell cycle sensor histidine kinase/response regulator CckA
MKKDVKTAKCSKRKTVLLAEDEELSRHVLSSVLQKEGYNVLIAENGRQALERAKQCRRRIHLLLTDVSMPEIEGPTLARSLQAIWRDLRVIVMSAHPAQMLSLDHSWTFISKPFVANALAQRIRELLYSEYHQGHAI